jgi:Asp-tRNA(Asn)/Glu-tRNA(Gln) amidotransferase A subunit family amidase
MLSRRSFAVGLLAAPLAAASPSDPADLTVGEAIALLRQRKLTPVELTQACLKRIGQLNPQLNAMITILGDQALAKA